jgi:hypothetical protein
MQSDISGVILIGGIVLQPPWFLEAYQHSHDFEDRQDSWAGRWHPERDRFTSPLAQFRKVREERFSAFLVFGNGVFALDSLACFGMPALAKDVSEALERQRRRLTISFDLLVLTEVRSGIGEELSKTVAKDAFVVSATSSGAGNERSVELAALIDTVRAMARGRNKSSRRRRTKCGSTSISITQ